MISEADATFLDTTGLFLSPTGTRAALHANGAAGGLRLGFNHQLGGFVIGAEAFQTWTNAAGARAQPSVDFPTTEILRTRLRSTTGVTARAGYAFGDVLVYGRAGPVWAKLRNGGGVLYPGGPIVVYAPRTVTTAGFTVGAGVEWRVLPDISLTLEYDYLALRSKQTTYQAIGYDYLRVRYSAEPSAHSVQAGLNYRFFTY